MSHGTIIKFDMSFLQLLESSPLWGLNVTKILESLIVSFSRFIKGAEMKNDVTLKVL